MKKYKRVYFHDLKMYDFIKRSGITYENIIWNHNESKGYVEFKL